MSIVKDKAITPSHWGKRAVDQRKHVASRRLDVWRKKHAGKLKNWNVVKAVRQTRQSQ